MISSKKEQKIQFKLFIKTNNHKKIKTQFVLRKKILIRKKLLL